MCCKVRQGFAKPSFRNGLIGSIPISSASYCPDSIMDNTVGFYPTNVGSIPSWGAKIMVRWQNGNAAACKTVVRGFDSHPDLHSRKCLTFNNKSGIIVTVELISDLTVRKESS